ncbi:hypothetical protein EON80_06530 [bacterium]|nr:MAG: hypothetical protein EON80_06530 [bacterium]
MKKYLILLMLLGASLTSHPAHSQDATDYKSIAVAAYKKGDTKKAAEISLQWLKQKAPDNKPMAQRDGDAVHDANQILGLVALQEKRVGDAKRFLVAAGTSPGSTTLETVGPNMHLAQDLLVLGERGIVVAYLNMVSKFWGNISPERRKELQKKNPDLLENIDYLNKENLRYITTWVAQIRAGETPRLNHSFDF